MKDVRQVEKTRGEKEEEEEKVKEEDWGCSGGVEWPQGGVWVTFCLVSTDEWISG